MKKIYLLPLFLIIFSFKGFVQDMNRIDLNGGWQFRAEGEKNWFDARVPGCVHLDLMRIGLIEDPFMGANESTVQWIGDKGWEYRREFILGPNDAAWRHIELVCKGLDTYANVYINDSLVMVADNMFRDWYSDIRRYLRPGKNVIRIHFPSVTGENKLRYERMNLRYPGDEKVVCRKAAYHFGWDWGPTLITSGIWRPIYIRFRDDVNVTNIQYIQRSLSDSVAEMTAVVTINSSVKDSVNVKIIVDSSPVIHEKIEVGAKSMTMYKKDFIIRNPRLWWPNGMGNQDMYLMTHEVSQGDEIVGKGEKRLGLRTIALIQEEDSHGKSFYFRVNGLPVFAKGANYIPQDNFVPRVSDSNYRALLTDAKNAGINMLRVWGGGIYENDIFYDLCDEMGIMVWQDFMFACAMYPGDKGFLDNVKVEAIQNIARLRHHPSLALWCGNNEIDEGWKNWGWQKQYGYSKEDSAEVYDTYREIFEKILPESVDMYDPGRSYIPTSPLFGWGRKESMSRGDNHYWGVWWGKEPFEVYRKKVGRFASEYGFQGFPDMSTIEKFTNPEDRDLSSQVLKVHEKHPAGFETIEEYMARDYRKPKDFESYAMVSQLLQAEGMKTAIEAHRRAMPRCMGTLYWQLNDCWPVISWSSRDYYGKKKALHYWLKDLYAPILISPVIEDGRVRIYVVSDLLKNEKGIIEIRLIGFDGETRMEKRFAVNIPSGSSTVVFDTLRNSLLDGIDSLSAVLSVKLRCENGTSSRNNLYFARIKELNLVQPEIKIRAAGIPGGFRITITSDKLAKSVFISTNAEGYFSDNYIDLLPGEKREIRFLMAPVFKGKSLDMSIRSLADTY
ncbi:MAG: glycoside hydrolase family 2 protein [bacterium]